MSLCLAGAPLTGRGAAPSAEDAALGAALEAVGQGRFEDAAKRLEPLARAGVVRARTQLGVLHYFGRGVPESDTSAYALFAAAAGGGDPEAMFWLGRMHLLGHAPAGDAAEADRDAARWFFEAARRGYAEAQYFLGLLFLAGTGVQKDDEEAQRWIRRAAAAGNPAAEAFVRSAPAAPTAPR